jgi:hypothetical protein
MLEWQSIESRIQKVKLHSCIAYRVVGVGLGSQYKYPLLYAFQGIGSSRRGTSSLGPPLESWHHHYRNMTLTEFQFA